MAMFVGFAPWILYWVLVSNNTFEEAAVAALVTTVVLTGWGITHGKKPYLLDWGTLVWFAALTIIAFTADDRFVADWSYALSNFALAAIVLVSIGIGHPFTRSYAREGVPKEHWDSPLFVKGTTVIAWAWFGIFVLMGISTIIAQQNPSDELWWNWIVPLGLFIAGIKFNHWYADHLRQQAGLPLRSDQPARRPPDHQASSATRRASATTGGIPDSARRSA